MDVMSQIDFGYPWWLSYGYLPIVVVAAALLALAFKLQWRKWLRVVLGILVVWSATALLVQQFGFRINGVPDLPAQAFLRSGTGRVLDIGAGTGRSSIMVLKARPQATLVALDLFAESFDQHFGRGEKPQERLLANLKAAGVDQRVTIVTADMRKIPFPDGSFDAIVSAYAMDHLNRQGSDQALAEAARVIKPGGDFLLMLIGKEVWGHIVFGPLLAHAGTRPPSWWQEHVQHAGFQVQEEGTRPFTLYILARRE